ncbi:MAG: cryptochrome/photolyase family protein, partial [Rhodospirillaceae bacterium]
RFAPFYREVRRRSGLLMTATGGPEGERWHHQVYHARMQGTFAVIPAELREMPDETTRKVLDVVARRFVHHFGDLEPFWFAVDHAGAERAFGFCLTQFLGADDGGGGELGGALAPRTCWAVIALYLNCGLLDPRAVCMRIEDEYQRGRIALGRAEAAIRLVLGWREFYRGIYWMSMPSYAELNHFNAYGPLPAFYWSGRTEMLCMHHAIDHGQRHAFSDQVSRLAVTGNFALLAGVAPQEVSEWQRAVYADAFEWADLPHAHGLVTFADGGLFTARPRLVDGSHIRRHFRFCERCPFEVGRLWGEGACPMNFLYWNFLIVNRGKFAANGMMGWRYRELDGLPDEVRQGVCRSAEQFLNSLA